MENWLPVPGYEGLYEVSDHGNVRSLPRTKTTQLTKCFGKTTRVRIITRHPGAVLNPTPSREGYTFVALGGKAHPVHRLVLMAFFGPAPPLHVARHLDNNPLNNHITNLAWGTPKQNNDDSVAHGTARGPKRKLDKRRPKGLANPWNLRCAQQMAHLGISRAEIDRCFPS